MSEYQFYEFLAIDKPLSEKDKKEIGRWSSRTNPTNTGAIFIYNYSDFQKNEIEVVEKYFDAMFYISNWGTTQLVFKLPNNLIDINKLKQYCIADAVYLIEKPDFSTLNICISDEEGRAGWIDGEGHLASLVTLRNDILSGDYRCLYLIWLKVNTEMVLNDWEDIDLKINEPQVPNNLNSLSGALLDFVDVFEIDEDAIAVAAQNSNSGSLGNIDEYSNYVTKLTNKEKDELLLRLLKNEPLLNIKLKNRLKNFSKENQIQNFEKRRTIGKIVHSITEANERRKIQEKRKREKKRLAKLQKSRNYKTEL
ncbi:MAG: hypothetical protein K8S23_01675 [Candidatus Cloacimonetes bacterium]|nr:hypothetical protein [Candidatus Cloacimonadota bacterium]